MFKTVAAALIAASMMTAPVFAAGNTTKTIDTAQAAAPTSAKSKAAAVKTHRARIAKSHVKHHVVKKHVAKKHVAKKRLTRKHVAKAHKAVAPKHQARAAMRHGTAAEGKSLRIANNVKHSKRTHIAR